jgi:hypothetical protein
MLNGCVRQISAGPRWNHAGWGSGPTVGWGHWVKTGLVRDSEAPHGLPQFPHLCTDTVAVTVIIVRVL